MPIAYTDGEEVESFILSLVKDSERIDSSVNIGHEHYALWPVRYHLSSQRPNLVRHLNWSGLKVLEIGAGMGAVSRFLAEQCDHLSVVEGTQARYEVLASRLRDLSNWDGFVGNFEDAQLASDYDVVCLIGVLEYAQLYVKPADGDSPYVTMLKHAKRCLKPGGVVLVAIENRLGLKYFAGCGEDHTSKLFDGICGYGNGPTPRTFSRSELRDVLAAAGLGEVTEQYPFPDYKMPSCVMGEKMVDLHTSAAAELASAHRYEDYAHPGNTLFPCSLVLDSLKNQPHLVKEISNSFLFLGSDSPSSRTLMKLLGRAVELGEVAWHYARQRKDPMATVFRESSEGLLIEKRALHQEDGAKLRYFDEVVDIEWRKPPPESEARGQKLMRELVRLAYYGDHEAVSGRLVAFFGWVFGRFGIEGSDDSLQGSALDAHSGNAFVTGSEKDYELIDQEWVLNTPMKKSWFVMRNICVFDRDLMTLLLDRWKSKQEFYEHLCGLLGIAPSFEEDLEFEAHLTCLLGEGERLDAVRSELRERLIGGPNESTFPREPGQLGSADTNVQGPYQLILADNVRMRAAINELRRHHQRKIYWVPRMLDQLIVKLRPKS